LSISALGTHGKDASYAPGGVTPGTSNSATTADAKKSEVSFSLESESAPQVSHVSLSSPTTPAHASWESPPRINARFAFPVTAFRNRFRSANVKIKCQSFRDVYE
jgi:hypothetical protein